MEAHRKSRTDKEQSVQHSHRDVNVTVNNVLSTAKTGVLEREWLTALLLSIFLGWLGMDSYYLGKTGKGILKMFTLGLFGILWLIDVIMIATRSVNNVVWRDKGGSTVSDNNSNWFVRHKVLSVILALVLVGIIAAAAGGGNKKTDNNTKPATNSNTSTNSAAKATSTPKIGDAVRDGKFEFTVKSIQCGKSEVVSPDSDALRKSAQGQYCVLAMTVKNIGSQQQGFFATNQKLLDAQSKQYTADDVATLYNSPSSQQNSWAQINPGNSVDATIVFDIPKDVTPTTAELHDSAFSGGAKVNLQ